MAKSSDRGLRRPRLIWAMGLAVGIIAGVVAAYGLTITPHIPVAASAS